MKHYLVAFAFLLLFSTLAANASDDDQSKPVGIGITDNKGTAIGMRFTPPEDEGWRTERAGLSVTLSKNTDDSSNNRSIEAYLMTPDTPVSPVSRYIKTIRRNIEDGYAGSKDFKISMLDLVEDPHNSQCARGHLLLQAVQPDPATQERKWSEQYFLSCGFHEHKRMGFELRYYHRYTDSNKDETFAEGARKVLDSVVVEDK